MAQQLSDILPKLHWRLMPTLLMMYVLAFLDRANIGFAKAAFQADAGIGDAAYAFGAGVFFVGYALLEVPSNLILHRVGARLWLARIMVTWGLVSAGMALVHGPQSFYLLRFLLGITEAGFFPGVIYYLSCWYPASARARSIGIFYYGAPLALTLGGPLSGLLVAHDAFGLHGWQVMFIVEGLMASLGGVAVLFLLKDSPAKAPWLTDDEKKIVLEALADDEKAGPRNHNVWQALRDPRLLYLALVYFLVEMGFYGLTFYLPTQVSKLMGTAMGLEVGLISALPWITALVAVTIIPPWCGGGRRALGVGGQRIADGGADRAVRGGGRADRVAGIVLDPADANPGGRGSGGRHRPDQFHRQPGRLRRAQPARLAGHCTSVAIRRADRAGAGDRDRGDVPGLRATRKRALKHRCEILFEYLQADCRTGTRLSIRGVAERNARGNLRWLTAFTPDINWSDFTK
jgi:MFS family permease